MNNVTLGDVVIGEGRPKICVPVIAHTEKELIKEVERVEKLDIELVEIRADFFNDYRNEAVVKHTLSEVKKKLTKPVIYTIRTIREGGEAEISPEEYRDVLINTIKSGYLDMVDVELFTGDDIVNEIVKEAHYCGVKVIMSNHDFNTTPGKFDIISRLVRMQQMMADIVKIAVMPESLEDMMVLLEATEEFNSQYGEVPAVTMSMSEKGLLSRISGEIFGSAITFGSAGISSAPGQINVKDLSTILDIIHRNIKDDNCSSL